MGTQDLGFRSAGRSAYVALCAGMLALAACDDSNSDATTQNVQSDEVADLEGQGKYCSATAVAMFGACGNATADDHATARAVCLNVSDDAERTQCREDADTAAEEDASLCTEQRDGRLASCQKLGEERYDPDFDPASFDSDFAAITNPNPFFPLGIGNRWEYRSATETDTVEVTSDTKLIEGVTCIVSRDVVERDGIAAEQTNDWFAQAKDGSVWYCGEEVKEFEAFPGDAPPVPELVSIDGSFKVGRNGDKPGIIFQGAPVPGMTYREEFSLGNAEDIAEVVTVTYAFGNDPDLDQLVPQGLADLFCSAGDCIVTENVSLLEPGVTERKFYARGVGLILEVDTDAQEVSQLVNCNFDPRCASIPAP